MWSLLVWCGSPCPTTITLGKTTPDQVMLSQDVAANVCTKSSSFSVASTAPSVLKTRGAQHLSRNGKEHPRGPGGRSVLGRRSADPDLDRHGWPLGLCSFIPGRQGKVVPARAREEDLYARDRRDGRRR